MNKFLKRLLKNWVLRNFPKETKTEIKTEIVVEKKVQRVKTIFVKKGKIREWRSYDENHNRIELVK